MLVPSRLFLTHGTGRHREKLISLEIALHDAKISSFNLVRVSSIFPPKCKLVNREQGLEGLVPGQVVFAVISTNATSEPGRLVAASIGLATPRDSNRHGYLSEHHCFGETAAAAGSHAESVAAQMLSASLGLPRRRMLPAKTRRGRGNNAVSSQESPASPSPPSVTGTDAGRPSWRPPSCCRDSAGITTTAPVPHRARGHTGSGRRRH